MSDDATTRHSLPDSAPGSDGGPPAAEPTAAEKPKVVRARATTVGRTTRRRAADGPKDEHAMDGDAAAEGTRTPVAVMDPVAAGDDSAAPHGAPAVIRGGLETASADHITLTQGGIGQAQGTSIDVTQGGIGMAQAADIALAQGGIGFARGDRVSVEMGAIGLAVADQARVSQGLARNVLGREVRVEQAGVVAMAAAHVTIERTTAVGILIAGRVDGAVRPILDWRGALALGAAIGLVAGLLRRR